MTKNRALVIMIALALGLVTTTPASSYSRPGADDESRGLGAAEEPPPPSSTDEGSDFDEPQYADQVIPDDLIVQGSACVGFDCINNENFGFDTIRLKENNLRIAFLDTSNTGSFPSNDWELTANESANGGLNHFSITDVTGGRTPFRVEAGARTNALYVESDGDIGIGTNNPALDVHVVTGDTPATRLEQDGSSGFGAQTWDIAGNETNFFIRDVTNGSRLPFRIRPGAPTSAIDIAGNGNVGMGTSSPDAALDIERSGNVQVNMTNTDGEDWAFLSQDAGQFPGFSIARLGTGVREFRVTPTGGIVIPDAEPAPPSVAGSIYFDGDTFCGYDGTAWRPLQAAGDQTCN